MKQPRERAPAFALAYAASLPYLQHLAREHGYAMAVHGSMRTDLDLVAVPWVEDARPAEELVEAIRDHVGGHFESREGWEKCPGYRAHGRRGWVIFLGDGSCYLDISVMPRQCEWGTETLIAPFFRDVGVAP